MRTNYKEVARKHLLNLDLLTQLSRDTQAKMISLTATELWQRVDVTGLTNGRYQLKTIVTRSIPAPAPSQLPPVKSFSSTPLTFHWALEDKVLEIWEHYAGIPTVKDINNCDPSAQVEIILTIE